MLFLKYIKLVVLCWHVCGITRITWRGLLAKRTISDKILKDRAYEIASNCIYDGYQRELASMVYKFLIRK